MRAETRPLVPPVKGSGIKTPSKPKTTKATSSSEKNTTPKNKPK